LFVKTNLTFNIKFNLYKCSDNKMQKNNGFFFRIESQFWVGCIWNNFCCCNDAVYWYKTHFKCFSCHAFQRHLLSVNGAGSRNRGSFLSRVVCFTTSRGQTPRTYNINWRDVQRKHVVNNLDRSSCRAP